MQRKINKFHFLLLFLFLTVLTFRLYFVFQTNNFSSDEAYFHLRHINHLIENKSFLSYDPLSYGGRFIVYPPFFHLLMAFLSFGNIFLLKIFPEIFLSSMVFIVYIICKDITKRNEVALICSFMSAFIPIFLMETINKLSVYSLVLPIMFLMIYSLMKIENKFFLYLFLVLSFLLPLTHPSAFLFVFAMVLFLIFGWVEDFKISGIRREAIFFSIFLIFLIEFIIYRKAFLEYGFNIIWQNIPSEIFNSVFRNFSIFNIIISGGILVLLFGFLGLYYCFQDRENKLGLVFSFLVLGIFLLLLLKMIPFNIGLVFLSLSLVVLSSFFILRLLDYVEQTRLFKLKKIILISLFVFIFLVSVIPSYDSLQDFNYIFDQKIHDLNWIRENTNKNSVVLGSLKEGNIIAAIAKRKNVVDTNFLLAPHPLERIKDVESIYNLNSEAIALKLLNKYNVDIIYLSDNTQTLYNVGEMDYLTNKDCFKKLRGRIYEVKC